MPALPSLADIKTYIGLTGTGDDTLLTALRLDAIAQVERDTGRTFASSSNVTTRYSTDGQAAIVVHDRPFSDASRVITWLGVALIEDTSVWMLPDRRDPNVSTIIQLRYFDTRYVRDFNWFDGNHDNPRWGQSGTPNDLVISGIIGHPFPAQDVGWAVKYQTARLYWQAKSGASGIVMTPTGEEVDVEGESGRYDKFVKEWTIKTAVAVVG